MRIALFYHSLTSDWNHGNAHFLRGIVTELLSRGHEVEVFEPANGWSSENLLKEHGPEALQKFHAAYANLSSVKHHGFDTELQSALTQADLVIVHEWNDPALVAAIGTHRLVRTLRGRRPAEIRVPPGCVGVDAVGVGRLSRCLAWRSAQ